MRSYYQHKRDTFLYAVSWYIQCTSKHPKEGHYTIFKLYYDGIGQIALIYQLNM